MQFMVESGHALKGTFIRLSPVESRPVGTGRYEEPDAQCGAAFEIMAKKYDVREGGITMQISALDIYTPLSNGGTLIGRGMKQIHVAEGCNDINRAILENGGKILNSSGATPASAQSFINQNALTPEEALLRLSLVESRFVGTGRYEDPDAQCGVAFEIMAKKYNVREGGITMPISALNIYTPLSNGGTLIGRGMKQIHVAESYDDIDRVITGNGGKILNPSGAVPASIRRFSAT